MATGRITADTVNALQAGAKDTFLWDDKLPGFGVKVTPKGVKTYILQYRLGGRGHKTKRYTIGKEGAFRATAARKKAEQLYGDIKNGTDIAAERREEQRIAVDLAFKPYVEDFCDGTLKAKWPKSWKQTKSCLQLHAVSHWGDKPLPSITAHDVRLLLRKSTRSPRPGATCSRLSPTCSIRPSSTATSRLHLWTLWKPLRRLRSEPAS